MRWLVVGFFLVDTFYALPLACLLRLVVIDNPNTSAPPWSVALIPMHAAIILTPVVAALSQRELRNAGKAAGVALVRLHLTRIPQ